MTLKEWTQEWIEVYVTPHRRPKTTRCYQDTLNNSCRNFGDFVETDIDKVTGVQVQKVLNQMGKTYSKSLCKTTRVLLNQSFRTVIQNDLTNHNPALYLKIPSYAAERTVFPFSSEEEEKIRKAAPHILNG